MHHNLKASLGIKRSDFLDGATEGETLGKNVGETVGARLAEREGLGLGACVGMISPFEYIVQSPCVSALPTPVLYNCTI